MHELRQPRERLQHLRQPAFQRRSEREVRQRCELCDTLAQRSIICVNLWAKVYAYQLQRVQPRCGASLSLQPMGPLSCAATVAVADVARALRLHSCMHGRAMRMRRAQG